MLLSKSENRRACGGDVGKPVLGKRIHEGTPLLEKQRGQKVQPIKGDRQNMSKGITHRKRETLEGA